MTKLYQDSDLKLWIKKHEGLKLFPYKDTLGNWTIGWGRNLNNGIYLNEAELMFQNDLDFTITELEHYDWFNEAPVNVQKALVNMNFNLGITKLLTFKKMIDALSAKNWTQASIEALNSKWARQVGNRAKDIALMIREGNAATGTN